MDEIRAQFNKPVVLGVACFVVGLIIGWMLLGWGLFPVEWKNASPAELHPGFQEDYLRMAIDSFGVNQDFPLAQGRWADLGAQASSLLATVQANAGDQDPNAITAFASAVMAQPATAETPVAALETAAVETEKKGFPTGLLVAMCVVTLVLGGGLVAYFLLRTKKGEGTITPAMQAQEAARQAEWTDYTSTGEESPMAQFMASYKIGDDLFDDSFSIDSPSGEFLGECGVGISETIGVGDPKKVTAFEVWLFDKNDIQTVTKVLMSQHAFGDETIRQRLAAKGEPVLAESGGAMTLETATLRLVARLVDLSYGEGALPARSYFDGLILEIAVWPK